MSLALTAVIVGVAALLLLVLRLRVHAFPALLLVSIAVGIGAGLSPAAAIQSVSDGVGGTLGFVAVVVGLGAMLGGILQASGGVEAVARVMVAGFGGKRLGTALGIVGLIVAIPVFLDVALVILAPVLYGLARRTGRGVIVFGLPLLAGMAAAHAFVPPTPGPIAVAELLKADLGKVILFGLVAGFPAMLIGGPIFVHFGARLGLINSNAPLPVLAHEMEAPAGEHFTISAAPVFLVIVLPLLLILMGTSAGLILSEGLIQDILVGLGHPFSALLISCAVGYVAFSRTGNVPPAVLREAMANALAPAGVIILITGAGGAFKQVLIDTGAGQELAQIVMGWGLAPLFAAFTLAALVRVAQGSATVAMITAAGLMAPITQAAELGGQQLALMTIAIASGAIVFSHVNDSGFWLVSRYLGLTEGETIRSWTIASTLVGLTGFAAICVISLFV